MMWCGVAGANVSGHSNGMSGGSGGWWGSLCYWCWLKSGCGIAIIVMAEGGGGGASGSGG